MKHIKMYEEYRHVKLDRSKDNVKDKDEPYWNVPKWRYQDKKKKIDNVKKDMDRDDEKLQEIFGITIEQLSDILGVSIDPNRYNGWNWLARKDDDGFDYINLSNYKIYKFADNHFALWVKKYDRHGLHSIEKKIKFSNMESLLGYITRLREEKNTKRIDKKKSFDEEVE